MKLPWLKSLRRAFQRRSSRRARPLKTVWVEELPEVLDADSVYVAGEGDHRWFVSMICPCGCGEILHMNLLPESRPRWRLTKNKDGTVTLYPSVWRQKGCGSHFFLRYGLIEWWKDD